MSNQASPNPPAETPEGGSTATRSGLLGRFKALALVFAPRQVQQIQEKGLGRLLVQTVLVLVVLPPVVALLAAFWLKQWGRIESPLVQQARKDFLSVIQEGFSMEEVATRSHSRLDYLQLFDYDLHSRSFRKQIEIDLVPLQRARIDIESVNMYATESDCSLPEGDIDLVTIELDGDLIGTVRNGSGESIPVGPNYWKRFMARSDRQDDPSRTLEFKLTDEAREITCAHVRIVGHLKVSKDLERIAGGEETR